MGFKGSDKELLQAMAGQRGGTYIGTTDTTTGPFCSFTVLTTAVLDTGTTQGGSAQKLGGASLPINMEVKGYWDAIKLASGSVWALKC